MVSGGLCAMMIFLFTSFTSFVGSWDMWRLSFGSLVFFMVRGKVKRFVFWYRVLMFFGNFGIGLYVVNLVKGVAIIVMYEFLIIFYFVSFCVSVGRGSGGVLGRV